MSTNALATVHSEYEDKPIVSIYKHWDGYPDGFGEELKVIGAKYTVGNGIPGGAPENFANGMECFAAYLVAELKQQPGDVYIYPPDAERQEYNYHLRLDGEHVAVTCEEGWTDEDED